MNIEIKTIRTPVIITIPERFLILYSFQWDDKTIPLEIVYLDEYPEAMNISFGLY